MTGHFTVTTADEPTWPGSEWPKASPGDVDLDDKLLDQARRYALTADGSGMIIRHGQVVMRWGDQQERYDIKSATKSFGATMLGVAIRDNKIDLKNPAREYHPEFGVPPESNLSSGWLDEVTVMDLATQTAGFDKPGGYERLLFRPGSQWHYSDGGPNWLAECLTLEYGRDLEEVMFERVFEPIGIGHDDLRWRNNQYRNHQIDGIPRREFGAGILANVEALSRLGYLYLREGRWRDQQIIDKDFVAMASRPIKSVVGLAEWEPESHGNASDHYSLLWWNNGDGTLADVPRDAYWAWGLYDSLIIVIPSLDIVAVRAGARGKSWKRKEGENHYHVLRPFLGAIVAADKSNATSVDKRSTSTAAMRGPDAPYPPSRAITGIQWEPRESIIRLADGSDNWPLTWSDDDNLYTAYGDGWGFEPKVEKKLSLGLARVSGNPPNISGVNLRSEQCEQIGQGANGKKASGMLMVDGVLYLLVRNSGNSQLAWSNDRGKSWTWADWKWTTSMGCPTFLNFGKDYATARDEYVYLYSLDGDSAYEAADQFVLARVRSDQIRNREAYSYFRGLDEHDRPRWTDEILQREPVFVNPGNCYRSGISYNPGLKRYLWCQVLPTSNDSQGPRFQGGFGIYEAAEPWGPWRTVYYTTDWDVGPGETSSLPPKWMSKDGKTVHLVFSGDDCFSVRRATLMSD